MVETAALGVLLIIGLCIALPVYFLMRLARMEREIADLKERLLERESPRARPFRERLGAEATPASREVLPQRHLPSHLPGVPEAAPAGSAVKPTGLTWHCSCGENNLRSAEVCRSCGRSRPPSSDEPSTQLTPTIPLATPAPPVSPPTPPPLPHTPPPSVAPTPPGPPRDLEAVLGANWLSKLGIAAIAIAAAFFLQYAFRSGWIGPTAQVAIGLAAALIMLGLGQHLLGKPTYRTYAQVLASGGIIVLFLSIYAAHSFYHPALIGVSVAFSVLVVAALAASALAVANRTEAVALLCVAGAFATPVLIRQAETGPGDLVRLYAYLAGLNLWSAILVRYRPWHSLTALSFAATWLLFFGAGRLHGPGYLQVEAFAAAFLVFACYGGLTALRARPEQPKPEAGAEVLTEAQSWSIALILGGCAAFTIASVIILAGVGALGLPAVGIVGVFVALLLSTLGAVLLGVTRQDALRSLFVYLSAAALVLLIGISIANAPATPPARAPAGFAFSLFTYLLFIAIALSMRQPGQSQGPAVALIAANAAAHVIVSFHVLAPVRLLGINAAPLWLPLAGVPMLSALWFARPKGAGETPSDFRVTVMAAAQALPLTAFFGALILSSQRAWLPRNGVPLFFGEFLLVSIAWLALRRQTCLPRFRGDLLGAFGNAGIFFALLAVTTGLQTYQGLVLLCGCALALAACHAVVGAVVLRRVDDDLLRRLIYLGLALTFVTIAVPLQLKASYITLAWAAESAILVWTGLAAGERRVRLYGFVLLCIAAAKALMLDLALRPAPFHFLANPRMLAGAAVIAAAYLVAWLCAHRRALLSGYERWFASSAAAIGSVFLFLFLSLDLWDWLGESWPLRGRPSAQEFSLSVYWSAFAVVLILLGVRHRARPLRWCGLAVLALAAMKILIADLTCQPDPFRLLINTRFLGSAAVVAAAYISAWLLWRKRETITEQERCLPAVLGILANALTLIFVSLDLWEHFGQRPFGLGRQNAQQLSLSVFWMVYALAAVLVGIGKRIRIVRLFAMGLLFLSILKVFLLDLSFLEQPYRIVSFFGLGVILLLVGLLYTRFEGRLK